MHSARTQASKELGERLKSGRELVLLAGAGVSAPAVRTGEQLAKLLQKENPRKFRSDVPLTYSEVFGKAIPRIEDRRARIEAECRGRLALPAHLWVAQLLKDRHLRAVVTTNFDHLIEQALMLLDCAGIPVVLKDDALHPSLRSPKTPPLVKIHGDFYFDDIANLRGELKEKLCVTMREALLGLTQNADLLVVGYGGGDRTVMDLISEIVRNRRPDQTRVWWSVFGEWELIHNSLLKDLLVGAERCGNAVACLGPWPAEECFRSFGEVLGIREPAPTPFGITGRALTPPTYFAWPLQRFAGSSAERSAALARHPRLAKFVKDGGVILVLQEPGARASTLLSAIAESAGEYGMYFDTRFASRPWHLDLQHHVRALAWQLGLKLDQLFQGGAVVVIDAEFLHSDFMQTLDLTVRGQQRAGSGALVIGIHPERAEALTRSLPSWPREHRIYRLGPEASGSGPLPIPPRRFQPLIDMLAVATTAIPERVAERAAGLSCNINWRSLQRWVERREGGVALRGAARRQHQNQPQRLKLAACKLAEALLEEVEETHPLRAFGLALEAEAIYFEHADQPLKALQAFLLTAESGLAHKETSRYFCDTLIDFLHRTTTAPGFWRRAPARLLAALASLSIKYWHMPEADIATEIYKKELVEKALKELVFERSAVDQEIVRIPLHWGRILTANDPLSVTNHYRSSIAALEKAHLRARRTRAPLSARAELALEIGALWDSFADFNNDRRGYEIGLRWSRRAKREAMAARNRRLVGLANDNETAGLLKLHQIGIAVCRLNARLAELGKKEGFSPEKRVTYGNLFHLALLNGQRDEAQVHFFEVVIHCASTLKWNALSSNLELLKKFAATDSTLPSRELIERTQAHLRSNHPTW